MPDLDSAEHLPLWLQIASALAGLAVVAWAVLVSFVRPWGDERWLSAMQRCSPAMEKHLREKVFARDYERARERDEKIDRLQDEIRLAISSLTQQGESLRELPALSKTLTQMTEAFAAAVRTLEKIERRVESLAEDTARVGGMI